MSDKEAIAAVKAAHQTGRAETIAKAIQPAVEQRLRKMADERRANRKKPGTQLKKVVR